jgi:hypothetical protein
VSDQIEDQNIDRQVEPLDETTAHVDFNHDGKVQPAVAELSVFPIIT